MLRSAIGFPVDRIATVEALYLLVIDFAFHVFEDLSIRKMTLSGVLPDERIAEQYPFFERSDCGVLGLEVTGCPEDKGVCPTICSGVLEDLQRYSDSLIIRPV